MARDSRRLRLASAECRQEYRRTTLIEQVAPTAVDVLQLWVGEYGCGLLAEAIRIALIAP
jgi:hypothetical protein